MRSASQRTRRKRWCQIACIQILPHPWLQSVDNHPSPMYGRVLPIVCRPLGAVNEDNPIIDRRRCDHTAGGAILRGIQKLYLTSHDIDALNTISIEYGAG
jgi:hypothetical protein